MLRTRAAACRSPNSLAISAHRAVRYGCDDGRSSAVMELVGWTNERSWRSGSIGYRKANGTWCPQCETSWLPFSMSLPENRFNGPELGAWYAADDIRTAAAEVGHHLRRETVARGVATMSRRYRTYAATLLGDYLDIRGQQVTRSDVYASERYDASQKLGEEVRSSGGSGLIYSSLRRQTGVNVVAHRPRNITDIVQTDHYEITVLATSRTIDVRKLSK